MTTTHTIQIVELTKPSTPQQYREEGYGQFKITYGPDKQWARLYGQPDTCSPSFLITGKFRVSKLRSGAISFFMISKEQYTYVYKNPGKVTRDDVNFFVQELELYTAKGDMLRRAMFRAVPCTLTEFKEQPFFAELAMETKCEYFRIAYETRFKRAFPGKAQKKAIQKLTAVQLTKVNTLLDNCIWKLWFEKYCAPFGLKEMTYEGYMACKTRVLPPMYMVAFRLYNYIKQIRKDSGHDIFPKAGLYEAFSKSPKWASRCTRDQFEEALQFLLYHGFATKGFEESGYFALPKDIRANVETVEALSKLGMGEPPETRKANEVPCIPSPNLTDRQRAFIQHVHRNTLTLLQGPPGTGKTEGLVGIMCEFQRPLVVTFGGRMVCALHGRFGGRPETAHTIHYVCCVREYVEEMGARWLEQFDLIVIDEGSNVDAHLFSRLMRHMSHAARLVIVGDLGQIFPIKPGCPFFDLVHAFPQHSFVLDENKRVDPDSRELAEASARVNRGESPGLHVHAHDEFEELFGRYAHDIMAMQIVTLRNDDRRMLNDRCEHYLLEHGILKKRNVVVKIGDHEYYPGKKIMFTKNTKATLDPANAHVIYEGYKNGELGQIAHIENNPVRVRLTSGKCVVLADAFDMCPGYATTCNKAQGSEWKHILFWIPEDPWTFFTREFPYVAISRAKKHCHILGREQDLNALIGRRANRRMTFLSYLLENHPLDNLKELVPYENVALKDVAKLTLLPKGIDAVPRFETEEPAKTKKKKKKRK